jgi:hypothetical protein
MRSTSPIRRVLLTGCCASLVLTTAAVEGKSATTAPSFAVRPVLVKAAGGAVLHYALDGPARTARVTIDGVEASVSSTGGPASAVYDAFVKNARLRVGRSYRVSISVTSRSGGAACRRERLYLHRRFPRN